MELQKLLKKQVSLALWQMIMFIGVFISFMVLIITAVDTIPTSNGSFGGFTKAADTMLGTLIICTLVMMGLGIPSLVLWIMGIINAIAINTITRDSSVLVVFSIITFGFVHLIIAVIQRNKFDEFKQDANNQISTPAKVEPTNFSSQKSHLDQALMNGVINSREYEEKLKELKGE